MANDCRAALPARAVEQNDQDVVLGTVMIDELQDMDTTANSIHTMSEKERQAILLTIRKEKKEKALSTNNNPHWRKKSQAASG